MVAANDARLFRDFIWAERYDRQQHIYIYGARKILSVISDQSQSSDRQVKLEHERRPVKMDPDFVDVALTVRASTSAQPSAASII